MFEVINKKEMILVRYIMQDRTLNMWIRVSNYKGRDMDCVITDAKNALKLRYKSEKRLGVL